MWTNFIDAASGSLCRGLNGLFGAFPSACLVNAGRPALFLAVVALAIMVAAVAVGRRRLRRQGRRFK